jgi:hypothetical protein
MNYLLALGPCGTGANYCTSSLITNSAAKQLTLYKLSRFYQRLDGTLTTQLSQLNSRQIVTLKVYINGHWLVLR